MDTVNVRPNERTEVRVVAMPITVVEAVLPAVMARALDRHLPSAEGGARAHHSRGERPEARASRRSGGASSRRSGGASSRRSGGASSRRSGGASLVSQVGDHVRGGLRIEAWFEPAEGGETRIEVRARALVSIPLSVIMVAVAVATSGISLLLLFLLIPAIRREEAMRATMIASIFEGLEDARSAPTAGFRVSPQAAFVATLERDDEDTGESDDGRNESSG